MLHTRFYPSPSIFTTLPPIYILPITPRFHPFPTLHLVHFPSLHYTFLHLRWFYLHFLSLHFSMIFSTICFSLTHLNNRRCFLCHYQFTVTFLVLILQPKCSLQRFINVYPESVLPISAFLCFAVNQGALLFVYLAPVVVVAVKIFIWFIMPLFDEHGYWCLKVPFPSVFWDINQSDMWQA